MRKALLTAAVCFAANTGFAASLEAQRRLDQAAADCASFENGMFDAGNAISEITLKSSFGDIAAEIVDESQYSCSSAASLYCGTGGCMLNVVVEGQTLAWQATGWRLEEWGPQTILLIGRDGGWCGGAGAQVCFEAITWSGEQILTVGPAPEER